MVGDITSAPAEMKAEATMEEQDLADPVKVEASMGVQDGATQSIPPESDDWPPMLRSPLNKIMPENVLAELTALWVRESPIVSIHNIVLNHKDMNRLLTTTGASAYLNDVCVDFFVELFNRNQFASFSFGSCVFTKYNGQDSKHAGRYIKRQLSRFEDSKGVYALPQFILFPICQRLHWTLLVLEPETHQVMYLDPMHPNTKLSNDEKETAWLFGRWVASEFPNLDSGKVTVIDAFETPLPQQTAGVSCGIFVILYMVMLSRGTFRASLAENIHTYRWRLLKCFMEQSMEVYFSEVWET